MARKELGKVKRRVAKTVLRLPDLDQAKSAALNSLSSIDTQRGYRHAIEEFIEWYCSEPRLTALMTEMVAATSANEAGALSYEWSLSADGATCHIFERYADSAAVLTHLGAFGEKFAGRFLETLTPVRCVVYGSPSPHVKEGLAVLNPIYMRIVGGFNR